MGRKAIERHRKKNQKKTIEWIKQLFPYLQETGLKGVTMDSVANILQKSKTTVYDYFQTKEELLSLIVNHKLQEIRGFEQIIKNNQVDFLDRYYQTLEFLAKNISDISNLFLSDLKELYPILWQRVEEFLDENALLMRDFYLEGIEAGAFRKVNVSILVLSDQIFFRAITNPDFLNKSNLHLQEAFEQYMQLKFFGLIEEKNSCA